MHRPFLAVAVALTALAPRATAQELQRLLPGDPAMDASLLAAGTDTTRVFLLRDGEEQTGPLQIEELRVVEGTQGPFLRQVLTLEAAWGTMVDTTEFGLPGLEPLRHRSRGAAAGMRDLVLDYGPDARVTGHLAHPDSGDRAVEHTPDHPVFDPGASTLLPRILPLEPGLARRVPFFNHESLDVRWSTYEVLAAGDPGTEDAPPEVRVVRQTLHDGREVFLWVRPSDRRIVEARTALPGGGEMRAPLLGNPPR